MSALPEPEARTVTASRSPWAKKTWFERDPELQAWVQRFLVACHAEHAVRPTMRQAYDETVRAFASVDEAHRVPPLETFRRLVLKLDEWGLWDE